MSRIVFFILTFMIFSCKEKKGYVSKDENNGDAAYSVTNEDEEMNKAVLEAQKTYNDFLSALKKQDSLMENFSVKMRFDYGDNNGEHMWLDDLYFKNEKLFGVLSSDPIEVKTVKSGDTLEVVRNRISDWMYLRNNKLVGGYTIKVLYNKMSEKEKEEFKSQIDFELE